MNCYLKPKGASCVAVHSDRRHMKTQISEPITFFVKISKKVSQQVTGFILTKFDIGHGV